jgi:hypothetical protein
MWLGVGDSVGEGAEHLQAPRLNVYNRAPRFEWPSELTPKARVADGERNGRLWAAKEINDQRIDEVIDQDPREFGYGSTIWTAPLLRRYLTDKHQIEVCSKSVISL